MATQNSYNNTWYPGVRAAGAFTPGDILYVDPTGVFQRLPAGTIGQTLALADAGGGLRVPSWVSGATPGGSAGGDLTGSYPNPSIAGRAVTFAKLQAIGTATFLGRTAEGTGDIEALTATQFRSGLGLGTAALVNTGTGSGNVPTLDASGYLPTTTIPPLRSHEFVQVANEAARLALTSTQVQPGDEAIQIDTVETYKLIAADPSQPSSWIKISDQSLDASAIVSGVLSPARLGTGTASSTTTLFGDGFFRPITFRLPVVAIAGTSGTLTANATHHFGNAARCTASLPTISAVGDVVRAVGVGAGGWRISQAAGQQIVFGDKETTLGATGWLESMHPRDVVELECVAANTIWQVTQAIGNLNTDKP